MYVPPFAPSPTPDTILCHRDLLFLSEIAILPHYPTTFHPLSFRLDPFPFGLQLVRTVRPLRSLTYGLPLESTTNASSRQGLKTLAPRHLSLTFDRPTVALFSELKDLLSDTLERLTIRYVPSRVFVNPREVLLCEALRKFKRVELQLLLPRARMTLLGTGSERTLGEDPESPRRRFIDGMLAALEGASEETQEAYEVHVVANWDIPGRAHLAEMTRIWPVESEASVLFDEAEEDGQKAGAGAGAGAAKEDEKKGFARVSSGAGASGSKDKSEHWERETNLRLLGGLFNLRLESKKH